MSILIKGMEIPKTCADCKLIVYGDGTYICPFSGIMALNIGRQDDCPLVEVKTPHGRLIDADRFLRAIDGYFDGCVKFKEWIQAQNIVIEAEE